LAVETMTELGVDEIVPWAAARAVVQWHGARGEKARARWSRTAREAAKQSRRAWLPLIAPLASSADVVARLAPGRGLVLQGDAADSLAACPLPDAGELVVVVGPEGGIAPDELAAFSAAGAIPVRMGHPVLRTSTAGSAALAALSVRLGRWR
jgi:16S rRNA (uracil1498-N3)-methyltransferase